jgi:mono/diheme cytochrome c family protein
MKNKKLGFFKLSLMIGIGFTLFLVNSCKHDGVPVDQLPQIPFSEVLPIFTQNCATCHDGQGESGGLKLTDYPSIKNAVKAGNSSQSKAYQAMISTFQLMPPNNPLTTSQRTTIRLWIDQGAKNN